MADSQTYMGNCHCGRFRFKLTAPSIKTAESCTCSVCEKKGYLWLVPSEGQFEVVRNDGNMTTYTAESIHDQFCNHCGTGVVGKHLAGPLSGRLAVNVRTIQGVNPFHLEVTAAHAGAKDENPQHLASSDSTEQHRFSCHCGAVQAELSASIHSLDVKEDNCSSCVRNAYIGVYPNKRQVQISGAENTFEYRKPPYYSGICHCKTCGVMVYSSIYGPPITVFDKLPPERKERALAAYARNLELKPLNVRAMEGVKLELLAIQRSDEGTEGYSLED